MKRFLFSLALIVACLATQIYSQFDSGYPKLVRGNSGLEIRIEATLDTTTGSTTAPDSLATGWVDITDFDDPTSYAQLYSKFTTGGASATDTSNVLVNIWGNETASWTGAVNVIQLVDTTQSETAAYTASTLSNTRPRYINVVFENKPYVAATSKSDDSVDVSMILRLPIKDAKVADE